MDPLVFFAAIPKIAFFLLLLVAGVIVAEVVYFAKRKESKPLEVSLPQTPQVPYPPVNGPLLTTEAAPPLTKRLSKKTLAIFLIMFFLLASIPAAVILVKQRQELRKEAKVCDVCNNQNCCNWGEACGAGESCVGNVIDGCVCSPATTPPPATRPPPPPPPEGCSNENQPCDRPGVPSECCGSLVCDYNICKPCSAFTDEARCWTHNKCYWVNGACQDRPAGTPPPGTGNITCSGSSVKNDTNQTLNCTASYFTCGVPRSSRAECEADPYCGGPSSSTSFTLRPGASKSFPDSSGRRCGVWQNDFTVDCGGGYSCSGGGHGCNWDETCEAPPPPTPTPTPPSYTAMCLAYGVYDTSWNPIANLSTLTVGQTVYFTTRGSTNEPQGLTKARFRINSGVWQETTAKHGNEFYIQYTIPTSGSFKVESMVFNPALGWK